MCVMAVVAVAPCQCFSPGGNHTTCRGVISSTRTAVALPPAAAAGDDQRLAERCVCHAVRAPGSNVTLAPLRVRVGPVEHRSMRTVALNQSAGPVPDACEPTRWMSSVSPVRSAKSGPTASATVAADSCDHEFPATDVTLAVQHEGRLYGSIGQPLE